MPGVEPSFGALTILRRLPLLLFAAGAPLLVALLSVPGLAQPVLEEERLGMPVPGEMLEQRFERRQPPIGARLGAFWVKPELALDERLDDNIFATPSGRRADAITSLAGRTNVDYAQGPLAFHFEGALAGHKYAVNTTESEWEALGRLAFSDQVYHNLQLGFGSGVQRLILPRDSPTGINGLRPTTYQVYDGHADALLGDPLLNVLHARVGANRLSYDPLVGLLGPINTSERNRVEVYGDLRLDHYAFGLQKVFAHVRPNARIYDQRFDTGGLQRSSAGVRGGVGAVMDFGPIVLTLDAGYQLQNYDDVRFGAITEPDAALLISWWPTLLTNLRLEAKHEYEEDFYLTSPGAVRNVVEAHIGHELHRRVILDLSFRTDLRSTVKVSQFIRIEQAGAKLRYQFAEGFSADVEYLFTHQHASAGATLNNTGNFDENILQFTVRKLF